MPKLKALILLPLLFFFLLIPNPGAFAEDITITTYYPAPFGVYNEMRSKRMAIGDSYYQASEYCWAGWPSCTNDIDDNADLIVEGNVGIGTTSPSEELEVIGNIIGTPIMGNWYPTAHGPNTSGGQHILVTFNASQNVTEASYFTNLGGTSGIRVNVAGYYHVEFVTLVYLGAAGDYGHVYLRRNGGNIDLDHGHYRTEASWDDRHCSWKGYMSANDYIQVNIYHQTATSYWYHAGPLYTRLTIQRLN